MYCSQCATQLSETDVYCPNCQKPVAGFIAGATAPAGRRMGHAGAVVGGAEDTAAAKIAVFKECGIECAVTPSDMADALVRAAQARFSLIVCPRGAGKPSTISLSGAPATCASIVRIVITRIGI